MKTMQRLKLSADKSPIVTEAFTDKSGRTIGIITTEFEGNKIYETIRINNRVTRRKSGKNV